MANIDVSPVPYHSLPDHPQQPARKPLDPRTRRLYEDWSKETDPLVVKTKKAADGKLSWGSWFKINGSRLFSWLGKIFNCFRNTEREQVLRQTFHQGVLNSVKSAPSQAVVPEVLVSDEDKFSQKVKQLQNSIEGLNPDQIREKLVGLTKELYYQLHKNDAVPPQSVIDLQELGVALESWDGRAAFRAYGQAKMAPYMPDGDDDITYTQFMTALESARSSRFSNRDGAIQTAFWGAMHPDDVAHVEDAHRIPVHYDSYRHQSVFLSETLVDGDHSIQHKYTPGLTGPRSIVENVLLPYYRRTGRVWLHIDNQSVHKPDERSRLDAVHEMAERNEGVFRHAVISTDPCKPLEKVIDRFKKKKTTPQQFIGEYEKTVRGINNQRIRSYEHTHGIHISRESLSDEELEAVFRSAEQMVVATPGIETFSPEEIVNIYRHTLHSMLAWAMMKKVQLHCPGSTFTQNCKENIDRGPFQNMGVVVLDRVASGKNVISREDAHLQGGITLGRAEVAMDRSPQGTRAMPFYDWLGFVDEEEPKIKTVLRSELLVLRELLSRPPAPIEPQIDPRAIAFADEFEQDHKHLG